VSDQIPWDGEKVLSKKLSAGSQPCADFRNGFFDGAGDGVTAIRIDQKTERFPGECVCLRDFDPVPMTVKRRV
jgi:hypothetical protein